MQGTVDIEVDKWGYLKNPSQLGIGDQIIFAYSLRRICAGTITGQTPCYWITTGGRINKTYDSAIIKVNKV